MLKESPRKSVYSCKSEIVVGRCLPLSGHPFPTQILRVFSVSPGKYQDSVSVSGRLYIYIQHVSQNKLIGRRCYSVR
jgi:hypothetical protein